MAKKKTNEEVDLSDELSRNLLAVYDNELLEEARETTREERRKKFDDKLHKEVDDRLVGVLPVTGMVIFPGVLLPVTVHRKKSQVLIERALEKDEPFIVCTQKVVSKGYPDGSKLYEIGTLAHVAKSMTLPDGSTAVIVEGLKRARMLGVEKNTPYLKSRVELLEDERGDADEAMWKATMDLVRELSRKVVKLSTLPQEVLLTMTNSDDDHWLINYICANLGWKVEDKQQMLEMRTMIEKAQKLVSLLNGEMTLLELKGKIQRKAQQSMNEQQREYYLKQQKREIDKELNGGKEGAEKEIEEMRRKGAEKKWSDSVKEVFEKELNKLELTGQGSPDYNVQLNYLDTLLSVPFGEESEDNMDIANAEAQLDKDHFGLKKVKERIVEHLAVLKLKKNMKSPILCLYGPPGVGKTSLGRSIATALGRKYVRVSLGGLHDESEIRGHRRTYIGSMPGRIVQNLIKAGTDNPVFVLDEIDKVGGDSVNGDPSSALLEVLDPEQNNAFHDNYLNVDVDLSKVMFIATANNVSAIPWALRDRMEMIEVNGYELEEKLQIATRHLIPKQAEEVGLNAKQVKLPAATLKALIASYTSESGVRGLDKQINQLMRKVAYKVAKGELQADESITIDKEELKGFLGKEKYKPEKYEGNKYYGLVTGLAWTAVGGTTLAVESGVNTINTAGGGKISVTGNLGNVMKESVQLAYEYIRDHAKDLNISDEVLERYNVHIHFPEGAIPKDGPSAGITIVTSMVSTLSRRKVRPRIAMTGEITLRGKVMPVGGIREKVLAAKRVGIKDILICTENRADVEEIDPAYLKGVTFHYVEDVKEVLNFALLESDGALPVPKRKEAQKKERSYMLIKQRSNTD